MLEDTQTKAKQAGMPIASVQLVMMAPTVVLAAGQFVQDVDDWEGLAWVRTCGMLGNKSSNWHTYGASINS